MALLPNIVLAVADAASVLKLFAGPQWGLFNEAGLPAFEGVTGALAGAVSFLTTGDLSGGQSIGEVEWRFDDRISTAPQEQGSFLSYNKVQNPYQARITYIVSGLQPARTAFIAAVQAYRSSLELLSLVMPEYTFQSCNIVHADFRRTAQKGVSMIPFDIWVEEVRITGTAAFTNTASPSGADPVNGGAVQPSVPTPAQEAVGSGQGVIGN